MEKRKNVLFVIFDQMRADCIRGALGESVSLPNLRGFASEAFDFRNHFSVASPCGPARASILTGQYAMNHRAVRNGTPLPHDKPNLARQAREIGYLPLLLGYNDVAADPRLHAPGDPALRSYEQVLPGFEQALEMRFEESWPWRSHLIAKGYDPPPYPDCFRPAGSRPDDPAFYRAEDSDTAFLTDRLIAELRGRPQGWFAHAAYIRPHPPFVAPAPYNGIVDPDGLPAPFRPRPRERESDAHPFNACALEANPLASNLVGFPELEDNQRNAATLRALYMGLVAELDFHFGRVLRFLRESGQYERTLIVATSDHGEMLGDFHLWGKMSYHDAAWRTPLLIRDPDCLASLADSGRDGFASAFTESVDVAPTILDLIGAEIPPSMDGVSLAPFLRGEAPARWRTHSFSELDFGDPIRPTAAQERIGLSCDEASLAVLRDENRLLVHFAGDLPQILLSRRAGDMGRDLGADSASQSILLEMSRRMLSHRMIHAEGLFSRTMVTGQGVRAAP